METRAQSPRLLILPVAFAFSCIVLTLLVFVAFGGSLPFGTEGYRINVPLTSAANLTQGSDVQISGVKIGRVVNVTRDGNGARATLQIDNRYAPLHTGATAMARTKTLLGEAYIEIAPGPQAARAIPDGGTISANHVQPEVQLDEFLRAFGPTTRSRIRQLFAGVSSALAGHGGQALNDDLGWSAPTASNLGDVLSAVDSQRTSLQGLLASATRVFQAVGARDGVLRAAVTAGNDVLAATASRDRALTATINALPPFLRQLRATSTTITAASPDLNGAVNALLPIAPLAAPALNEINRATPIFTTLFKDLPATIASGRRGLPSVSVMVTAARTAFAEFYPVSRQLIPIIQLMAANPTAPEAPFADVANLTGGVFAGPGGLVQHYATGLPTVWNETVGGWIKRLPTNILNPYVRPGGQLDIARLGYIKSFDCRNINNPLYLPATGTGSPPCVQQSPWTFDGRTAFYPRLYEAPK